MNFNDYQQAVAHRFKSDFSTVDALMVAVSGILIELDEVGRATTKANEHEELGDVLFYIAYSKHLVGWPFNENVKDASFHIDTLNVTSELTQSIGCIHKIKRGKRTITPHDLWQINYSISLAYRWVEQQGVDMESLYQANIKKVSSL